MCALLKLVFSCELPSLMHNMLCQWVSRSKKKGVKTYWHSIFVLRVWHKEDLHSPRPSPMLHFGACHCLTVRPSIIPSYYPSQSLCLSHSSSLSLSLSVR